jgi:hypothetical protein
MCKPAKRATKAVFFSELTSNAVPQLATLHSEKPSQGTEPGMPDQQFTGGSLYPVFNSKFRELNTTNVRAANSPLDCCANHSYCGIHTEQIRFVDKDSATWSRDPDQFADCRHNLRDVHEHAPAENNVIGALSKGQPRFQIFVANNNSRPESLTPNAFLRRCGPVRRKIRCNHAATSLRESDRVLSNATSDIQGLHTVQLLVCRNPIEDHLVKAFGLRCSVCLFPDFVDSTTRKRFFSSR